MVTRADRMILGSHVIFSAYGFWLPNDPRGSWSDFVGSWELFRFGLASLIESGHRQLSKTHIRILSEHFRLEPGLFLAMP